MVSSSALATHPRLDPRRLALAVALGCAACGLAMAVYGLWRRPYGAVEAELVFQASRIQKGFPLYVDPAVGAWEQGPPPSRYYVLYTPLWPWLLAHISPGSLEATRTAGRLVNAVLLLAALVAVVRASKPANRLTVVTGAALALGFEMLVREATLADADMPAVLLSTLGLIRMNARRGLDAVSAPLLAMTPLVKPSVLGGAVGAVLAHVIVNRRAGTRRLLLPLAAGAIVGGAFVALYHVWSDGAWLRHIARATGQTISVERWFREFGARAFFLGVPHSLVCLAALRAGSSLLATLPLVSSIAWATFAMAKHGSGTHYWLEPTMAALIALGTMPPLTSWSTPPLRWAGFAFVTAAAAVSLIGFARSPARYEAARERVAYVRAACPLRPGEVVVAGSADLELEVNRRVLVPAWQSAYLIRTGRFPLDAWREDLARPQVRCLVHERDYLDPPPERIEGITEVSPFRKELRDVVEKTFTLDSEFDGLLVFHRR
jgi:hypothetical protein